MTLVEHTNQTIVLSCHHSEKEADCKLSCLAAYPWEVLACLARSNNLISFLLGACDSCPHKSQMLLFERSLSQSLPSGESFCLQSFTRTIAFFPPQKLVEKDITALISSLGKCKKGCTTRMFYHISVQKNLGVFVSVIPAVPFFKNDFQKTRLLGYKIIHLFSFL